TSRQRLQGARQGGTAPALAPLPMSKRKTPPKKDAPRRLPVGAEVTPGGVHFRVWAPRCRRVEVVFEGDEALAKRDTVDLTPEADGYFSGTAAGVGEGALYRYRLDGGDSYPDPASRFQPAGPHGPS